MEEWRTRSKKRAKEEIALPVLSRAFCMDGQFIRFNVASSISPAKKQSST